MIVVLLVIINNLIFILSVCYLWYILPFFNEFIYYILYIMLICLMLLKFDYNLISIYNKINIWFNKKVIY